MNSAKIVATLNQFVSLNAEEIRFLESILIPRPFKQGETIVKSGDTASHGRKIFLPAILFIDYLLLE